MENYISSYIRIKNNKVWLNGKLVVEQEADMEFGPFMKSVYKFNGTKYLKFFKMDKLSKLGFIAAETLLGDRKLNSEYKEDEVGIILSNSNSTIDIDTEFYNTVKDKDNYFPSPALFVYTLPNIMVGEISIKNCFRGENSFFVTENYQPDFTSKYINQLFEKNKVKACIGGWVDYTEDGYDAFMYLAEQKATEVVHNTENIEKLYIK